jgi:hypothetical protein
MFEDPQIPKGIQEKTLLAYWAGPREIIADLLAQNVFLIYFPKMVDIT